MNEDKQKIIAERERIKGIIESCIEMELNFKVNNSENLSKRHMQIKVNYLKARLEHLQRQILWKIDNPNYQRKPKPEIVY